MLLQCFVQLNKNCYQVRATEKHKNKPLILISPSDIRLSSADRYNADRFVSAGICMSMTEWSRGLEKMCTNHILRLTDNGTAHTDAGQWPLQSVTTETTEESKQPEQNSVFKSLRSMRSDLHSNKESQLFGDKKKCHHHSRFVVVICSNISILIISWFLFSGWLLLKGGF